MCGDDQYFVAVSAFADGASTQDILNTLNNAGVDGIVSTEFDNEHHKRVLVQFQDKAKRDEAVELVHDQQNPGNAAQGIGNLSIVAIESPKTQRDKESFSKNNEIYAYYFTILGLLLASSVFVLGNVEVICCTTREALLASLCISLIGLFGVCIAGCVNYCQKYHGACLPCHIVMHGVLIANLIAITVATGSWGSFTLLPEEGSLKCLDCSIPYNKTLHSK